jgi:RNA polymerase-binding protein DksA
MNAKDKQRFRNLLLDLGRRMKGQFSTLENAALRSMGGEASGGLSNAPQHLADLGTDTFEQEMSLCLLENENQQLEEVGSALERLDAGTFGRCEQCDEAISIERLEAVPYARLCIDCARSAEQGGWRAE